MSAAAYERLREKVKGPEDLEQELSKGEALAEIHFALESDPTMHERARTTIEKELLQDPDGTLEHAESLSPAAREAIAKGRFTVQVGPHPKEHHDAVLLVPEGNVQETIALKPALSDRFVAGLLRPSGDA